MTSSMSPYLNFRGQSAAALDFYQSVFGGQTHVLTFGQGGAPPADHPAAGLPMHGELRGDVVTLQASDAPEGVVPFEVVHGNDLHLCLQSDDVAEERRWAEPCRPAPAPRRARPLRPDLVPLGAGLGAKGTSSARLARLLRRGRASAGS